MAENGANSQKLNTSYSDSESDLVNIVSKRLSTSCPDDSLISNTNCSSTDSSDSELYFSTEEKMTLSNSGNEHFIEKLSSVSLDEDSNQNNDPGFHVDNLQYSSDIKTRRKRNKRQKRKQREKKWFSGESFNPLLIDSDNNLEFDTVMSAIKEKSFIVEKIIPSLVELCLRCSQDGLQESDMATRSLRRIHKVVYRNMFLCRYQLSWMLYLLSNCEKEKGENCDSYNVAVYNKDRSIRKYVFPRSCRNIWNQAVYVKNYEHLNDNKPYTHVPLSACLSYTHVISYISLFFLGYEIDMYLQNLYKLSVFATAIDLMMPTTTRCSSSLSNRTTTTTRCSSSLSNRTRVKHEMQKRFPIGTKMCFDTVIPYVYWARGEIKLATELFLDVIQKESKGRMKALFLNEIARMYSHIDDIELAARFYRMACDAALDKSRDSVTIQQICGQTQMLLANLNDQGLLTAEKARKSKHFWMNIVTSPEIFKDGSARAGIEALLCYHGYSWTVISWRSILLMEETGVPGENHPPVIICKNNDVIFHDETKSWLHIADDWLTTLIKDNPDLCYHVVMLHGLMGNIKESHRQLSMMTLVLPVHFKDLQRKEMEHWGCLATQSDPVSHLKVLWRTQLCPALYNTKELPVYARFEADFCNPDLNLRLNTDGFLTGDMQMVLPPIRGIYLNPYTGIISFSFRETEPWSYHNLCEIHGLDDLFYIPTPYELYSDADGIKVHLLQPKLSCFYLSLNDSNTQKPSNSVSLVWTNNSNERSKVNLRYKITEFLYKKTKEEIDKKYSNHEKRDQLLDFAECFNKYQSFMSLKHCERCVKLFRKSKKKNANLTIKIFSKQQIIDFEMKLQCQTVWYGKTLMLTLHVSYCNSSTIKVIIDCSSKESFMNPVFYSDERTTYSMLKKMKESNMNTRGAEIAWFIKIKELSICILNKKGDIIDNFSLDEIYGSSTTSNTQLEFTAHVMGDRLVYIHPDKRLWIRADEDHNPIETFTNVYNVIVINADLCLIKYEKYICVYNISTEKCVSLKVNMSVNRDLFDIKDGEIQLPQHIDMSILKTKQITDNITINRLVLVLNTLLLILEVPDQTKEEDCVTITTAVLLPGYPTDFCFVSETVGFLVTWSHSQLTDDLYHREHLFHFSSQGQLLGALPFLGASPFSFCAVYLSSDRDIQDRYPGYGSSGWHVYMRDGHGGIIGLKLSDY